ncbi:MAG TPA: TMEM165/GDT1 family protein [Thermoanaerobaculia bacterium]|nr:TMEM165/GDT1 family protein [Thermoanaerobaculia bacterium]
MPAMLRTFFSVFATIFLAEVGDKTQLATILFASEAKVSKWLIFAAAALALVVAAAIGVLVGAQVEKFVSPRTLKIVAGIGFIAIGFWTIFSK